MYGNGLIILLKVRIGSARQYWTLCLSLMCVIFPFSMVRSQSVPIWKVTHTNLYEMGTGYLYQVDSQGHLAQSDVDMDIINPRNRRDYELPFTVDLSPWMNQTVAYSILAGYEPGPGAVYTCIDAERAIGLYNATDNSVQQFCLATPFLTIGDSLGALQRNPYTVDQIFAAHRYLIDLKSQSLQDISSTFPSEVNRTDVTAWVAHGSTWWDSISHLPTAHIQTYPSRINDVLQQDIQICPLLVDTCETLVSTGAYVHGAVDNVVISPDGQYILWSMVVFPTNAEIVGGSPMGLVQNIVAFQTRVSSGETTQIFDLHNYDTNGAIGRFARWSPDGRRLVVSLENTSVSFGSYALFVDFEPIT